MIQDSNDRSDNVAMPEPRFSTAEKRVILQKLNALISQPDPDFDYPDYGGLPDRISNRFSSEQVDAIQEWVWRGQALEMKNLTDALNGQY